MTMRDAAVENRLNRRNFLQGVGMLGLAAALPQAMAEAQAAAATNSRRVRFICFSLAKAIFRWRKLWPAG